jgi:glycosyltransferase involved in cell wall biosynthesis
MSVTSHTRRPLRVVLAGAYPEREGTVSGGIEAVTHALATELASREGIELHVVSVRRDGGPDEVQRRGDVTVHLLARANSLPYVLRVTGADPRRVRRVLERIRPDVVHAHGVDAPALAALRGGWPTLFCVHGIAHRDVQVEMQGPWDLVRLFQMRRLERMCFRYARHVAAISTYVTDAYKALLRAQVTLIENPVPDSYYRTARVEPTNVILFAGHLRPLKGVHTLIDSLAEIVHEVPAAEVRLAGSVQDRSYVEGLKRQAEARGVAERVRFLGHLNEAQMLAEYARCQVLCLPSQQENTPVVIQQAMAAGRPVVATRIAGIPGLVGEGTTGLLTSIGDVHKTASAILSLLRDIERACAMGEAGRREAERRFRLSVVGDRTLTAYEAVLRERS